jgi:hypothetical protein
VRDCLNFAQSANTFSNIDMEIQNAKVDADFEFVEKFAKMFTQHQTSYWPETVAHSTVKKSTLHFSITFVDNF